MDVALKETDLAFSLLKAAKVITLVIRDGRSLDQALNHVCQSIQTPSTKGAIRDLSYFGLRNLGRGVVLTELTTKKPELNPLELTELMALGFALLWPTETPKYPQHTVVNQIVNACGADPEFQRAKGLVNACLRTFLREMDDLVKAALKDPLAQWNMPGWWLKKLQHQHPKQWENILNQAKTHAPLVLRVNSRWGTPSQYLDRLTDAGMHASVIGPQAVWVHKGVHVDALPGFAEGHVSVQDSAAQLAAPLLKIKNGDRVLDACAAPGGKTGHLLELASVDLTALDSSGSRLPRVQSNVDRIAPTLTGKWHFQTKASRAEDLDNWWDGKPFDAILADVPCTGSGVVRRHPDIPWLRRADDVVKLSHIQHKILSALWSTLKPGGTLLLVTCSIFSEEGPLLAKAFIDKHSDATPLPAPGLVLPAPNKQLAEPFAASPDGFFYALFQKKLKH